VAAVVPPCMHAPGLAAWARRQARAAQGAHARRRVQPAPAASPVRTCRSPPPALQRTASSSSARAAGACATSGSCCSHSASAASLAHAAAPGGSCLASSSRQSASCTSSLQSPAWHSRSSMPVKWPSRRATTCCAAAPAAAGRGGQAGEVGAGWANAPAARWRRFGGLGRGRARQVCRAARSRAPAHPWGRPPARRPLRRPHLQARRCRPASAAARTAPAAAACWPPAAAA
jgi:hypothetical protein